jgi:hypothetical protein
MSLCSFAFLLLLELSTSTRSIQAVHFEKMQCTCERPSLVLVINDTKLLMPCVKCFELGISNTCDEGVYGEEWWPQDHKEMVHGHEMMIMVVTLHLKDKIECIHLMCAPGIFAHISRQINKSIITMYIHHDNTSLSS